VQINKFILFISCVTLANHYCYCDIIEQNIDLLTHGNKIEKVEAINNLAEHYPQSITRIYDKISDNIDTHLKNLGADSYKTRLKATKSLMQIGIKAKSAVQKTLDESPDPEVRFRCKKVLQSLQSKPLKKEPKPILIASVKILLKSKAPLKDRYVRKIFEEYLSDYPIIDEVKSYAEFNPHKQDKTFIRDIMLKIIDDEKLTHQFIQPILESKSFNYTKFVLSVKDNLPDNEKLFSRFIALAIKKTNQKTRYRYSQLINLWKYKLKKKDVKQFDEWWVKQLESNQEDNWKETVFSSFEKLQIQPENVLKYIQKGHDWNIYSTNIEYMLNGND
jgi:hypothetical protein